MKLATEIQTTPSTEQCVLRLPFGLIGLPRLTIFSFSPIENSWPFMSLNSLGDERMNFVVIDPSGLIPEYELELNDEDGEALQLGCANDALVLNIVTLHSSRPQYVTVNLIGPIVVNRRTGLGKQVIIQNWSRYSSQHALIDQRDETHAD